MRASRREPVERTPVWFMRQAGRSLPEYREIRKQHGLFEICRRPELCAEVTLQPVRRARRGRRGDVRRHHASRPRAWASTSSWSRTSARWSRRRFARRADVERLIVPEPEESVPFILEAVRLVREALARRAGGDRLRRRAVHGGRLPDRGQADPRVQADEGVHVRAAGGLARADGEARRRVRALRRRLRRGPGRTRSSSSTRGSARSRSTTTASSSRPTRRSVLDAVDVPTIHFGTGDGAPARGDGGSRRRRDRRRLADSARRRLGASSATSAASRATSSRAVLLGPWERVEAAALRMLERASAGGRVTSSTSATACCRRPIRPTLRRLVELVHENTLVAAA